MSVKYKEPWESASLEITKLLEERLSAAGINKIQFGIEKDHKEEDELFIDIYFDLTQPGINPQQFMFLTTEIREIIEKHGQSYYQYLRYHFDPKQKVSGWR